MRRVHDWLTLAGLYAVQAGYWIKPYDMLADCRRWRWRKPLRCLVLVVDNTR